MSNNPLTLLHLDPASRSAREVAEDLGVSPEWGLEPAEARRRLHRHGPNVLRGRRSRGWLVMLLDQLGSPATALLAGAAILSAGLGEGSEGLIITAVLLLRVAIGLFTDLAATRSMNAFYRLRQTKNRVRRGGEVHEVSAEDLVPGDVVLLGTGETAPADLRLLSASGLRADESVLTGAPDPVDKDPEPKWPGAPLQERTNMVFGGTELTGGSGEAVVVSTGAETELGRISAPSNDPEPEPSPLRGCLRRLGRNLTRGALLAAVLVAALGFLSGEGLLVTVQLSVALFVAAVPENLGAVAALTLFRGMLRMSRRGILVNRPAAVESLGSTDLLWTEEAGVLTGGRMTVARVCLESGETSIDGPLSRSAEDRILRELLEIGVLCNDASSEDGATADDPAEVALLEAAAAAGLDRRALVRSASRVRTVADPDAGTKATYHKAGRDMYLVAVKGAPAAVLKGCTRVRTAGGEEFMRGGEREWWGEQNERLAGEGLRVLAVAAKEAASEGEEPYENLTLLGLVGLEDPPGEGTPEAVDRCRRAGVRVVAATADQPETVRNIVRRAGLLEDEADVVRGEELPSLGDLDEEERRRVTGTDVFAGLGPERAAEVISAHRQNGSVVAVANTGRDALTLEAADTSIVVGERGPRVARSIADFVLGDAAFPAVAGAMAQTRSILANANRYIVYRISCAAAVIATVATALLAGLPAPVLPLQVLLLSLLTHVFPALALGSGSSDTGVSGRPVPDWRGPVTSGAGWLEITVYAGLVAASALAAFTVAVLWTGVPGEQVVTVTFLTLAFAQLWNVANMRGARTGLLDDEVVRNPYVWAALAFCAAALIGVVYAPGLAVALGLERLGLAGWAIVLGMSPLPPVLGEANRWLRRPAL
ncbi:MAG: HAD-IC family P-type ATPase [Actinomycetota bacterium]|nr:HAD-IC family P-type ATPase [Actinomycetota bacterium]